MLAEYPHFKAICHDDFAGHFEFVEKWDVADYRARRRQGVFVTAHMGNWGCPPPPPRQGIPVTAIYARAEPVHRSHAAAPARGLGCRLVSLEEGARPLLRELGEGRSVALVVDARDDDGVPIRSSATTS